MLADTKAFSGFAVKDLQEAQEFYGETLGLNVSVVVEGNLISLDHADERMTLVYRKEDVEPGNYTILNFPVDDIDKAVEELGARGVSFERYEGFDQDEKGIARGFAQGNGPDIAWFKDPSGHILSVVQES
jgi:catechol 2,3-dioxygenase-like lactoylglutathione lyase family enzyme